MQNINGELPEKRDDKVLQAGFSNSIADNRSRRKICETNFKFLRWSLGFSLAITSTVILFQGFHFHGFTLSDGVLYLLISAT
jgi:hypothetical protein